MTTDVFSKYTLAFATRDQKESTVARLPVDEIFNKYVPQRIYTDQGTQFQSALLRDLCKVRDIKRSRTTPYHPARNGQCERFHRIIHQLLRTLPGEQKMQWTKHIGALTAIYNKTPSSTTGFYPYFLIFGTDLKLPIDMLLSPSREETGYDDWVTSHWAAIEEAWGLLIVTWGISTNPRKD